MKSLMHFVVCGAFALAVVAAPSQAQVVPTTPGKFTLKPMGETGTSAGIASTPRPSETSYRQVTYITLSQPRQWKSADGRSLLGKLIAFEDIVSVSKNAAPDAKTVPEMPSVITVVRGGKARLLVNSKPYEVALDRLGEEERNFVKSIESGVKAQAGKKP